MRLSRRLVAFAGVLAAAAFVPAARADILITIDKSTQQMTVAEDGALLYTWPVSTGAPGYDTPSGEFKPFRMERHHFSREWDDAPMPHSIFFTREGHAIHGSNHVKAIGTPASHGCVRLMPKNAGILFELVKQEGMSHTQVVLTGETPERTETARRQDRAIASVEDDDVTGAPPPRHVQHAPRHRHYRRYYRYYYFPPYFPFRW